MAKQIWESTEPQSDPSWGMVSIARRNNSYKRLHGSELNHAHTIAITVCHGEVNRRNYEEHYSDTARPVIEIEMSPLQFAELITTANVGGGVPCTINYMESVGYIPYTAPQATRREESNKELRAVCNSVGDDLDEVEAMIGSLKMGVKDKELLIVAVRTARGRIVSQLPHLKDKVGEAIDRHESDAKASIEAFFVGSVQRMGLDAVQSGGITSLPTSAALMVEAAEPTGDLS